MNAFMGRLTFSKGSPLETTGLPAPSRSWGPEDEEVGAVGVGESRFQAWSCEEPGTAMGGAEGKPSEGVSTRPPLRSETLFPKPGILSVFLIRSRYRETRVL